MPDFKEFCTSKGEVILYCGQPDLALLEKLADGPGDIWHSSFEQGLKNAFPELMYQTITFFWYIKDFDAPVSVSWRINPEAFCVRKTVWETLKGFDTIYLNPLMAALDFGYHALRFQGAVPLYVKGLFTQEKPCPYQVSTFDRYAFFSRNFKKSHATFMLFRKGWFKPSEWAAMFAAFGKYPYRAKNEYVKARELQPLRSNPTVSYIIPTMSRQDYTLQLLNDLKNQTYLPTQVVVVDATPEDKRDESLYNPQDYPFQVVFKWQTSKGSCRARNEAIALCSSEYIIFGDDDIRLPADFIANHLRFLQTYQVQACSGLDIRADHQNQDLSDLEEKIKNYGKPAHLSGCAGIMTNSNGIIHRDLLTILEGNDVNFDGGYGEDLDFGISMVKNGILFLQNPYSQNLHLKPPAGGYRVWGNQAKVTGKKRKSQPWEMGVPVKRIRPVPSPTVMYYFYKNFGEDLVIEYKKQYFFKYLFKGSKLGIFARIFRLPYRLMQFQKSQFYAKRLQELGKRLE